MAFDPISLGISLVGGLLGSKNKAPTQTESRAPWAPAQPYLTANLEKNKELQDYYAQNPFNPQQKQGYQNLFTDADHFRGNVAPGLMDFANGMMGSKYQRKTAERPGGVAGYGLLNQAAPQGQQSGLLAPFSVAQTTPHGQIDWNKQNPFYKTPEQIEAAKAAAEAERLRQLALQQQAPQLSQSDWWQMYMTGLGGGDGGAGADGSPGDGGGSTW